MAQQINRDDPEAGQTPEDKAVADAELMVWGAKAALHTAERNLRVAYETLASVLGARNDGAFAASPLSSAEPSQLRSGKVQAPIGLESAHKDAGLAGGPEDSSDPDDVRAARCKPGTSSGAK